MDNAPLQGGNKIVLFVDDESYIADVGKEMLEDYGYPVDIMTSSRQALESFRASPLKYDLVITDYAMPEISGDCLAREIQQIRPGIPVIMCSGIHLPKEVLNRVELARVLIKPFDMDVLVESVREILGPGIF